MALAMEDFKKYLEVVRQEKKAQTSNIIARRSRNAARNRSA
jgi:hypothetical protein